MVRQILHPRSTLCDLHTRSPFSMTISWLPRTDPQRNAFWEECDYFALFMKKKKRKEEMREPAKSFLNHWVMWLLSHRLLAWVNQQITESQNHVLKVSSWFSCLKFVAANIPPPRADCGPSSGTELFLFFTSPVPPLLFGFRYVHPIINWIINWKPS